MTVMTSARSVPRWTVPPELSGMVPRDVQLSPAGRTLAALVVALIMAALMAAIAMSVAAATAGVPGPRASVDARALHVEATRGKRPRRIVTYTFSIDGRTYGGRTTLRERDHRDVFQGTPLPVGYVVSDPGANWIRGYEPGGVPVWLIPLVSISLLAVAGGIALLLRRSWVLLSEGRAVQAQVLSQRKVRRDKHPAYEITSEFRDLSGARHTMRYDVLKAPPAVGSTLTVVYHRDDPRWHAVYPLPLVRPTRAPQPPTRTVRTQADRR